MLSYMLQCSAGASSLHRKSLKVAYTPGSVH